MRFITFGRQVNLFLTFGEAFFLIYSELIITQRATDTSLIMRTAFLRLGDGMPAAMALIVRTHI